MGLEIFKTVAHLYNRQTPDWIFEIEEEPSPVVINKVLSMNVQNYEICKILNKYIFVLEPRAWLLLAWSMVPKYEKAPFVKYIKTVEEEEDDLQFLWDKVKKKNEFYGNDFRINKDRIFEEFDKNKEEWFKSYGIEKKYWKQFGLDFNKMYEGEREVVKVNKGLEGWF